MTQSTRRILRKSHAEAQRVGKFNKKGLWKIHELLFRSRDGISFTFYAFHSFNTRVGRHKTIPTKWLKKFGSNVNRQRYEKNWTQEKLAEAADLSPRHIQDIEAGKINVPLVTLVNIQRALGCSLTALVPSRFP